MVATLLTNAAESNRAVLRYIPEVTWGTTPTSGLVKEMRITSSSLQAKKTTKISNEIRADRMVSDVIETAAMTDGGIKFEMSAGGQDDLYQAFLLSTWSQPMNYWLVKGASVSVTGVSTITILGKDWRNWLADDKVIKLEGFLNFANNGYFIISGTPAFSGGNTVITVDETSLVTEAGSAYTKAMDANDILVKATDVTIVSGNKINKTGWTTGLGLQVGQKLYFEGLGKDTGTILCNATDPSENDKFTVSDGVDLVTFEIATSEATVSVGNVWIPLSGTPGTLATSIAAAINLLFSKERFRVSATVSSATVTLTNHRGTGGHIVEALATITGTDFSGGSLSKFGFVTIASISTDYVVTVETLTADANSGNLLVIIKGSHVRNPGVVANITKQSMSAETGFTDVGKYLDHNGLRVGDFSLAMQPGNIVTGDFNFMGRATTALESTVLGDTGSYTVLEALSEEVFNATSNVGDVLRNGAAMTTAILKLDIKGSATLRNQPAVGAKFPAGIGYGRFTLSGTLEAYFQNFDLYRDFINHTTASIAWNMEDNDHMKYYFTIPSVKYDSDPIMPTGIDKDVTETIAFTAFRDNALGTMFMIDRFSSVWPFDAVA